MMKPPSRQYIGYYDGYHILKWDTPVSAISYGNSLLVEKLLVTPLNHFSKSSEEQEVRGLTIEIRNEPIETHPGDVKAASFFFPHCIALRVVDEYYFSGGFEGDLNQLGSTLIVENSPWIAKLKNTSPTFDLCGPSDPKHYMILTNDYTIEVISDFVPTVKQLDCFN